MGRRRRWVSWLLVVAGLTWIAALIVRHWSGISDEIALRSWGWLGASLLGGALAISLTALPFHAFLDVHAGRPVSLGSAARLLFVGQMVRHLPGRFWGLVYQVNASRAVLPAPVVVRANVDLSLMALAFNLLVPAAVLLWRTLGATWGALVLAGGLAAVAAALRRGWLGALWAFAVRRLPARWTERWSDAVAGERFPWRQVVVVLAAYVGSWVVYLGTWQLFALALTGFAEMDLLLACAGYAVAWLVGFVTMVTPAGLGVREAVFVAVSAPLAAAGNLAVLAVFVRVWLLVIDAVLFLACLPLAPPRMESDA